MSEPLDLEPIKARLRVANGYTISEAQDVIALIAEVERLREEMRQVKIDFHWATG